MEELLLLCDSNFCRLCGESNEHGIYLFSTDENSTNLHQLINKYLPLVVDQDQKFPKYICPGCHIQLESTKLFLDLIVDGQSKLRILYKKQQELLQKQVQIEFLTPTNGPLYITNHTLRLQAEGLDRPKRKRGRPAKKIIPEGEENIEETVEQDKKDEEEVEEIGADGRRRRKIRAPIRFQGVVQGKELEDILKKEGVIDEESKTIETISKKDELIKQPFTREAIIGRIEDECGEDLGQPVFIHKPRIKPRKAGILRKINFFCNYNCKICLKPFIHELEYIMHVKTQHKKQCLNISNQKNENKCSSGKELEVVLKNGEENKTEIISIETDKIKSFPSKAMISGLTDECEEPLDQQTVITKEVQSLKKFNLKSDYEFKTLENEIETAIDLKPYQHLNTNDLQSEAEQTPEDILELSDIANLNSNDASEITNTQDIDDTNQHICEICNRSFSSSEDIKLHLAEHIESRKFTCDICGKVLQHSSSLLYHKQTKHNTKRFICITCNRSFKHPQLLQRHQIVHSEDRPHACPVCNASFKTHGNLINHEAVHTGEKKFECTQCGQKFVHKASLMLHQRWHEGKKPYTCEFCQKTFSQNGNLLEHKRIHTGEKPFFCEVCGKNFTTSSQLKIHAKRHTGEKPYQCEVCAKSFLYKDTYKFHVRRHFNERRSLTEPWAVKKYVRNPTGDKPYKCELCGKTFADKSNRNKHMRTHSKVPKYNGAHFLAGNILPYIVESDNASGLQLTQLVDQQGNPISITTHNGQTVAVVTSGDDDSNLQGLMPDGTLVPIEIASIQEKFFNEEIPQDATLDLLETASSEAINIQDVLESKEIVSNINSNFQLLTDNGEEVCLVTYSMEEDGALTQELVLESALDKN